MTGTIKPRDAKELRQAVEWALGDGITLDVRGGGSKTALGKPMQCAEILDVSSLSGVVDYAPEELVVTLRAGTPMREVEALLAQRNQMLAFEPPDLGPLLGQEAGQGTLVGAVSANFAGPRRLSAGAARDHLLGFSGVNGRGEAFKSGGKVMKNVTGYDLSKLLSGSWGTLAVLDEVSVKVLPAPDQTRTLVLHGLSDVDAVRAMCAAMGSPHDVSGAAHLAGKTALRIEGVGPSRCHVRRGGVENLLPTHRRSGDRSAHPGAACRRQGVLRLVGRAGVVGAPGQRRRRPPTGAYCTRPDRRSRHAHPCLAGGPHCRAGFPSTVDGAGRAIGPCEAKLRSQGPLQSRADRMSESRSCCRTPAHIPIGWSIALAPSPPLAGEREGPIALAMGG